MKKRLVAFLCALALVICIAPKVSADVVGDGYRFDLSGMIASDKRREYVEMMLDYHLRNDPAIQETLRVGHSAVFLFDGCSDNLDDEELKDLSYYRVSAVCIVVRLDESGEPFIAYFNEHCSTLPDRPLDYSAWWLAEAGDVGPATVVDGTYELYSVRHNGVYEALHMRTSYGDEKVDAVYMSREGYVKSRADKINVHTRTGNHIIKVGMWSAGCMLVGGGDYAEFTELMECTYYKAYDKFDLDRRVGTLTIDRFLLKGEMGKLYYDTDAVDMIVAASRNVQAEMYLRQCGEEKYFSEPLKRKTSKSTSLMTLPCSNQSDARSRVIEEIPEGEKLTVLGSIENSVGNVWYLVDYQGQVGYLFSVHTMELGWFEKLTDSFMW